MVVLWGEGVTKCNVQFSGPTYNCIFTSRKGGGRDPTPGVLSRNKTGLGNNILR